MQIREDLQKEQLVPVWNTETGRCLYVKHTPTLDVEYMWSPDDGRGLNDEGANTILKIRKGDGEFYNTSWNYHPDDRKMLRHLDQSDPRPAYVAEDLLVYAVSIDWEDKEHTSCVPEVPAATEEQRESLHDKAQGKVPKWYQVGMRITNAYKVEAYSEEEAEEKVRALDVWKTLDEADYDITCVDEITE